MLLSGAFAASLGTGFAGLFGALAVVGDLAGLLIDLPVAIGATFRPTLVVETGAAEDLTEFLAVSLGFLDLWGWLNRLQIP